MGEDESGEQKVRLDLNSPRFQLTLFELSKKDQRSVLNTLRKLSRMTWAQIHSDSGLNWELIRSRRGAGGQRLYSFRIGKGFRGVAFRDGNWLAIVSLHPDHDSAYGA
ncbi:MAG: hypothetical protein GY719_03250 [bacterium]|nr:hypothetical protein [bacterium]